MHIVIKAGDLDAAFPYPIPDRGGDDPIRPGEEPIGLGERTFGKLDGTVFIAPRYPTGGIDGGHVVFVSRDANVAISLHAWPPTRDVVATLGEIVGSIQPI